MKYNLVDDDAFSIIINQGNPTMKILKTEYFDNPTGNIEDGVFLVKHEDNVDVFHDSRGTFAESYKNGKLPDRFLDLGWCKQINTSSSEQFVFRGFHAQTGAFCQGKMVECTLGKVIDVIIDFRPDSKSFGKFISVELTANSHDKLWIPRGFLHGFFSQETPPMSVGRLMNGGEQLRNALNQFMYMCDNVYNKDSEVSINPYSFFARVEPSLVDDGIRKLKIMAASGKLGVSAKDAAGMDYSQSMAVISEDYQKYRRCWYKSNIPESCNTESNTQEERSSESEKVNNDRKENCRNKKTRKSSIKPTKRHK